MAGASEPSTNTNTNININIGIAKAINQLKRVAGEVDGEVLRRGRQQEAMFRPVHGYRMPPEKIDSRLISESLLKVHIAVIPGKKMKTILRWTGIEETSYNWLLSGQESAVQLSNFANYPPLFPVLLSRSVVEKVTYLRPSSTSEGGVNNDSFLSVPTYGFSVSDFLNSTKYLSKRPRPRKFINCLDTLPMTCPDLPTEMVT